MKSQYHFSSPRELGRDLKLIAVKNCLCLGVCFAFLRLGARRRLVKRKGSSRKVAKTQRFAKIPLFHLSLNRQSRPRIADLNSRCFTLHILLCRILVSDRACWLYKACMTAPQPTAPSYII